MFLDLLHSKDNISNVIMTSKDTTMMAVVALVFHETIILVCQFHITRIVRAKCITYFRVESKHVKVDGKDKKVKVLGEIHLLS